MNTKLSVQTVSVIIPVYNTEKYLPACLDSLIASVGFASMEVLAVNDGSTDNSLSVLEKYAAVFPNIRILNQTNGGLSSARNAGLKEAKAPWIFFLDSDDEVETDYISKLLQWAQENNCDFVTAGFSEMQEDGLVLPLLRPFSEADCREPVQSGISFLERCMERDDRNNQVWCALYRREFLQSEGLSFDESLRIYEDILFTNQVRLRAGRTAFIPVYGYLYRCRPMSLVRSGIRLGDIEALEVIARTLTEESSALDSVGRHAVGRLLYRILSKLLYDFGELKQYSPKAVSPADLKRIRALIDERKMIGLLKDSRTSTAEKMKYVIFRLDPFLFYRLVKAGQTFREVSGKAKRRSI